MLVHVIDDNAVNCEIFASIASRIAPDLDVESFLHPAAGLAASRSRMPDLIIVDFMMPEVDGLQYVEAIRSLPGGKLVPTVMITAATDRTIRQKALEIGVTDFLTKPIDKHEVRARLTNLLALRRSHSALQERGRWLAEEVRKATEQILHQANHDALTELPNRAAFLVDLETSLQLVATAGGKASLLYADLDGFKKVNDSFGHGTGDHLLREVGRVLRSVIGDSAKVARLGGDEFAVLVGGDLEMARSVADAVILAVSRPIAIDSLNLLVGCSVGICCTDDTAKPDELLKCADLALYDAKRRGGGLVSAYMPNMLETALERTRMEADLRIAIRDGQFGLVYQPILNLREDAIIGYEALIRWHHPSMGVIPPDKFIPLAEDTGQIVAIGEWVLREACSVAATWPAHLSVAVNVSSVQLRSPLLFSHITSALADSGLAPGRLEIELTETAMVENGKRIAHVLTSLRTLGVSVAMDDFGTGYSSLAHLRNFPFDRVKIDRSFVATAETDRHSMAVLRGIIQISHELDTMLVGEGVETSEQLDLLRALGCDCVQGFLIGRPLPATRQVAMMSA